MASKKFEDLDDDDLVEVLNDEQEVEKKDQYAVTAGSYVSWFDTYDEAEENARSLAARHEHAWILKAVAYAELDTSLTKVEKYV